jgi:hypothetical protein
MPLRIKDLIDMEDRGFFDLAHDVCTDCHDLFELLTGSRGVPQDRSQRLIIMSLRELRALGRIRNVFWQDTKDMLANSLTKHTPYDEQLWRFLKTGYLHCKYRCERRFSTKIEDVTELQLEDLKI